MNQFRAFRRALAGQIALFGLAVVLPVWLAASRFCYANYDFGIYSQAIALLGWQDLNPWLSGRQVRIFSDHFDPILWVAKCFTGLLSAPMAGLVTEACMVLLALAPILWLRRRGKLDDRATLLVTALLLFNIGTLDAVHFPIHPTTWAMAPLAWLMAAVSLRRPGIACVALLLLCACKEEFPFVGVVLMAVLWQQGARSWALASGVITGAWLAFVFIGRPLWFLDGANNYGVSLFRGLQQNPWGYFALRATRPDILSRLGTLAVSFAPVVLWQRKSRRRSTVWELWLLLLPLLSIRFLGMAWRFHHLAPLSAGTVVACTPYFTRQVVPRWVLWGTALLLATSSSSHLRFAWQVWTGSPTRRLAFCPKDPGRLASIAAGFSYLRDHASGKALLSGNLLPGLVDRPEVYAVGGPHAQTGPFAYVMVEKPPLGDPWPLKQAGIDRLIATWRDTPTAKVLCDDAFVFLATGAFTVER